MTLSSEHSEFKTCPNCGGDGYEDNPPMRKCGICKGRGRVSVPREKRPGDRPEFEALAPGHEACTAGQGGA